MLLTSFISGLFNFDLYFCQNTFIVSFFWTPTVIHMLFLYTTCSCVFLSHIFNLPAVAQIMATQCEQIMCSVLDMETKLTTFYGMPVFTPIRSFNENIAHLQIHAVGITKKKHPLTRLNKLELRYV